MGTIFGKLLLAIERTATLFMKYMAKARSGALSWLKSPTASPLAPVNLISSLIGIAGLRVPSPLP